MQREKNKTTQKKYKDTVFRLLYKNSEYALSLYNGLNGTEYKDPGVLVYNTLENAIYMNMKNDLSFVIAHQMNLYEHQSTVNPNMPLRVEKAPERMELKLSDAYERQVVDPALELKVTVLNINPGMNELLKKKYGLMQKR